MSSTKTDRAAKMSSTKVSLKLLIDTESKKVLFAEAGKDFVDFLFNLLALPVGTVIRLLTKSAMVGGLGKLYGSIEELSDAYLQSIYTKESLLRPKVSASAARVQLLPADVCPSCNHRMSKELTNVEGEVGKAYELDNPDGFVKGVVTYMVMDDLVVKPMSTISSITMLNKFNIKEVGALEEKVVDLNMDQGLKLLKASLQLETVLTNVFL